MPAINKPFHTTPGSVVTFSVTIGYGQVATTLVTIGGLPPSTHKDSFSLVLGPGEKLVGKTLQSATVVTDVRKQTNQTSVNWKVTDGVNTLDESREEEAEHDNGIVKYGAIVRFK